MCMMKVVVLREMLGARETGWRIWSGKDVMEMTSRDIKKCIENGEKICGLTIGADGELICDVEGFFCTNVMEYRSCGNYRAMLQDDCMTNLFYICIGKHEENGVNIYDCISTRFEQLKVSESDLKAYLKIGIVSAGAKLVDDKIVLPDMESKSDQEKKELPIKEEPIVVPKVEAPVTVEKSVAVKTEATVKEEKPVAVKASGKDKK